MVSDVGSTRVTSTALLRDTLILLIVDGRPPTTSLCQRHRGMQKLWYRGRAHSPCLSSVTEKNEKRAIFARSLPSSLPSSFPPCCPRDPSFAIICKSVYPERKAHHVLVVAFAQRLADWMDRLQKKCHYGEAIDRCPMSERYVAKVSIEMMKYRAN